jgi:hypothetical protein
MDCKIRHLEAIRMTGMKSTGGNSQCNLDLLMLAELKM